ncbi:MAG TPA: glycoside hydrolase family 16 protein [Actinocrinis sp.]|nr:glycoside hydrolase family 16 protein [Actinocrinis sp.]
MVSGGSGTNSVNTANQSLSGTPGADPTASGTTADPSGTTAAASAAPTTTPAAVKTTAKPTAAPPPAGLQPLGVGGSWSLDFDDEFSGSSINTQTWSFTSQAEADEGHGNPTNFQLEWDQEQNCSVSGGDLTITAQRADYTSPGGHTYGWTSCLLSSKPSFAFHYGYMEMRAQLPYAAGFWPGFWTWQTSGPDNETDAMEYYSNDRYHVSLFQHSDGRGGCAYAVLPFNATSGFHTYGADVEPTGTTWYLDGQKLCSTSATSTGMTNLMLSMFVYSKAPPQSATQSATEEIDYVRAWARG